MLLKEIRDSLQPKQNISIVLLSNFTDWTTYFSPPLHINFKKQFTMALVNLEMYNSILNITILNNIFTYSVNSDVGDIAFIITLPEGSYEVTVNK